MDKIPERILKETERKANEKTRMERVLYQYC